MDKILFILAILYKSPHVVLGSGGSDETGWKAGILIFSSLGIFLHHMAFVLGLGGGGGGGGGSEKDKISNKNHPRNHQHTVQSSRYEGVFGDN